jgi:hypothetical protein
LQETDTKVLLIFGRASLCKRRNVFAGAWPGERHEIKKLSLQTGRVETTPPARIFSTATFAAAPKLVPRQSATTLKMPPDDQLTTSFRSHFDQKRVATRSCLFQRLLICLILLLAWRLDQRFFLPVRISGWIQLACDMLLLDEADEIQLSRRSLVKHRFNLYIPKELVRLSLGAC